MTAPVNLKNERAKFALAGFTFYLIANPLFNLIYVISLRMLEIPASIRLLGSRIRCGAMDGYEQTHPAFNLWWLRNGWTCLLLLTVFIGWSWYLMKYRRHAVKRSAGRWTSILLITIPMCAGAYLLTVAGFGLLHGRSLSDVFGDSVIAIFFLPLVLVYCIAAGLWLYFNEFQKSERRYLWLFSLPAIIITHLLWIFVLGPAILY